MMLDYLQIALFLAALGYAAVRWRLAPIAGSLMLAAAMIGLCLSVAAVCGVDSLNAARSACWIVVALCVVAVLEKRALVLGRQVTALAQHLAIRDAKVLAPDRSPCGATDSDGHQDFKEDHQEFNVDGGPSNAVARETAPARPR